MKLSSHGYKVKELKMYDMPMGELKLVLLQKMQEKRPKNSFPLWRRLKGM